MSVAALRETVALGIRPVLRIASVAVPAVILLGLCAPCQSADVIPLASQILAALGVVTALTQLALGVRSEENADCALILTLGGGGLLAGLAVANGLAWCPLCVAFWAL